MWSDGAQEAGVGGAGARGQSPVRSLAFIWSRGACYSRDGQALMCL